MKKILLVIVIISALFSCQTMQPGTTTQKGGNGVGKDPFVAYGTCTDLGLGRTGYLVPSGFTSDVLQSYTFANLDLILETFNINVSKNSMPVSNIVSLYQNDVKLFDIIVPADRKSTRLNSSH
jgi:hypothetical protein